MAEDLGLAHGSRIGIAKMMVVISAIPNYETRFIISVTNLVAVRALDALLPAILKYNVKFIFRGVP